MIAIHVSTTIFNLDKALGYEHIYFRTRARNKP